MMKGLDSSEIQDSYFGDRETTVQEYFQNIDNVINVKIANGINFTVQNMTSVIERIV